MPNPASTTDLENRWHPLEGAEVIRADTRLDDAWDLVLTKRPNLEANIANGSVSRSTVIRVVCDIALRVLKNEDGLTQEAIDDYSFTRSALVASGILHVTAAELSDITPFGSRQRSTRLIANGDYGYGFGGYPYG